MDRPVLSFVIITKNAEKTLGETLRSIPSDQSEVIVLDSGSVDATMSICQSFGAQFHTRPFDDFSSQKNAACELANGTWIFVIDADEVLSEDLIGNLYQIARSQTPSHLIFDVQRRLVFMGRRMCFGRSIDYPRRFFKKDAARFQNAIHEVLVPIHQNADTHSIGRLKGSLFHHSYANLSDYFVKFNHYTTLMAKDKNERNIRSPGILRLVLRPWANFLYRYLFCLGFLDGYPGYVWSLLGAFYSFTKYAKLKEIQDSQRIGKSV